MMESLQSFNGKKRPIISEASISCANEGLDKGNLSASQKQARSILNKKNG